MNVAVAPGFPLTQTQRDIYFHQVCCPSAPICIIDRHFMLGAVNEARMQHSHAMLVRAHDAFGIRIVSSESGTHQRIVGEDERTLGSPIIDLSDQPISAEAAREKVARLFEARTLFEDTELFNASELVRWLPDGASEFLGRCDSQNKLRGFRIGLGEIERKLRAHPNVREALVLLREDVPYDQRLVAYLTYRDETSFSAVGLRMHLASHLPDYMLPSAFVVVDAFPLTTDGKLDRKALLASEDGWLAAEYEPPQGHTEEALVEIWRELLGVPRVGRHDNFSALGGHSLLAITLSVRILQKFQIWLPPEALCGAASPMSMSELIVNAQANLFNEKEVEEMEAELAFMSDEELLAYLKD